MLYKYKELLKIPKYNSNEKIFDAINNRKLFKMQCGLYSDKEKTSELEEIAKKYEKCIFTSDTAFFYYGLTDNIPKKYFVATKKKAKKINDNRIVQTFMEDKYFLIGDSYLYYNNVKIRIYDKERMLIELVRNRNSISYDMYKEIINNYRVNINELNLLKLQEYINEFSNGANILTIIEREVL